MARIEKTKNKIICDFHIPLSIHDILIDCAINCRIELPELLKSIANLYSLTVTNGNLVLDKLIFKQNDTSVRLYFPLHEDTYKEYMLAVKKNHSKINDELKKAIIYFLNEIKKNPFEN